MAQFQSYVICTSPRSGSTLLCRLLREAGNAGFPDSHFHAPDVEKWLGYYGLRSDQFSTSKDALKPSLRLRFCVEEAAAKYSACVCSVTALIISHNS